MSEFFKWPTTVELLPWWSVFLTREDGFMGRVRNEDKERKVERKSLDSEMRKGHSGEEGMCRPRIRAVLGRMQTDQFVFLPPSSLRVHMVKSGWNEPLRQPRKKKSPGQCEGVNV